MRPFGAFVLAVSSVFLVQEICLVRAASQQAKVIKKLKTLISTFPTDAQYTSICNTVTADVYNGKALTDMANDVISLMMSSMTGTQMTQGLQIYNALTNDLGGMSNAMALLTSGLKTFQTTYGTLLTKIQTKVNTMKAAGQSQTQCSNQVYKMGNKAFTKAKVKKMMVKIKASMTAANWAIIKKDVGSAILFSQYGV